jgi:hypothetical protein
MIWDLDPCRVKRFFSSLICSYWLCGPPSLLRIGCWCSCRKVKQPGHEVDHKAPSSAKFENEWSCTFVPPSYLCVCRGSTSASLTLRAWTWRQDVFPERWCSHSVIAQKATLWVFSCSCNISLSYATWLCNVTALKSVVKSGWRHSRWTELLQERRCQCGLRYTIYWSNVSSTKCVGK